MTENKPRLVSRKTQEAETRYRLGITALYTPVVDGRRTSFCRHLTPTVGGLLAHLISSTAGPCRRRNTLPIFWTGRLVASAFRCPLRFSDRLSPNFPSSPHPSLATTHRQPKTTREPALASPCWLCISRPGATPYPRSLYLSTTPVFFFRGKWTISSFERLSPRSHILSPIPHSHFPILHSALSLSFAYHPRPS